MAINTEAVNFFMPVVSFLFIFVLIYAILAKTKALGDNKFVHFFISALLAVFFLVRASLVEFVQINAAIFAVFIVCIFFIILTISFTHGKVESITKPWVAWVLVGLLIIIFIWTSSSIFGWAIQMEQIQGWAASSWFGVLALLVVALLASWVITKK